MRTGIDSLKIIKHDFQKGSVLVFFCQKKDRLMDKKRQNMRFSYVKMP